MIDVKAVCIRLKIRWKSEFPWKGFTMKKIRMFLVIALLALASLMVHGCHLWQPPAPPGLPPPPPLLVPGR
jgi:hypothetical protein